MKHPKSSSLPYRPCVGLMMINRQGFVFMGKRLDTLEHPWQMPQGGIDLNEAPEKAALRELYEETGATTVRILAASATWHAYDIPKFLQARLWNGLYRGQRQKWFLIGFEGQEEELNVAVMPTGHDPFETHREFEQWQWVNPHEMLEMVVKFKRSIYKDILHEFLPFIEQYKQGVL